MPVSRTKRSRPSKKQNRPKGGQRPVTIVAEDWHSLDALQEALEHDRKRPPPVGQSRHGAYDRTVDSWLEKLAGRERLGIGQHTVGGVLDRLFARLMFFRAVGERAPEAVDRLHDLLPQWKEGESLLPQDKNSQQRGSAPQQEITNWNLWARVQAVGKRDHRLTPLVEAIQEWAKQHHLTESWLLEAACWNLRWWAQRSHWSEIRRWRYPAQLTYGGDRVLIEGVGIPQREFRSSTRPQLPAYNPLGQTREDYEKRALAALRRYMTRIEADAEREGFRKTIRKRSGGFRELHHFEWLVQYQVLGRSFSEIARVAGVDRKSVANAVKSTATVVGLKPRPPAGAGRPRGARSRYRRP